MRKLWRNDQSRMGLVRRRKLEFQAVMDNVIRRKDAFMQRLQRNLVKRGSCLCYRGTLDHKGYARLNLSHRHMYRGVERKRVTIHAHRLFLILKLKRPIRRGYEAGHLSRCEHRTCVVHVREEHYRSNAATAFKRAA